LTVQNLKRIQKLIEGLHIIAKYSNEVYAQDHQIIAGPVEARFIREEDQKVLEDMDWFFEENDGWTFYVG